MTMTLVFAVVRVVTFILRRLSSRVTLYCSCKVLPTFLVKSIKLGANLCVPGIRLRMTRVI